MESSNKNIKLINSDENHFSAFEQDAQEGFRQFPEANITGKRKFNRNKFIASIIIGAFLLSFFVFIQLKEKNSEKEKIAHQKKWDQNDWALPDSIEKLVEIPKIDQIKLPVQPSKKTIEQQNESPEMEEPIQIGTLPLHKAKQSDQVVLNEIILKKGKEIYVSGIKLVDYRGIRHENTIETNTITMSGTPAEFEAETHSNQQPDWKAERVSYHLFISEMASQLQNGNFKQALNRCNHVLKTYPNDVNAQFYSAFCLYNLGDFQAAKNNFQQVKSNETTNFQEEANWYLALTYIQLNEISKAKEILEQIIDQNTYYKSEAKKKLRSLTI